MQDFDIDRRLIGLPDADHSFPRVMTLTGDESNVCARLDVSPDLACFRGHFPSQPVLPGVVQLHWAVQVAQACFAIESVPREIKRLKFKHIVVPPQELTLTVTRRGPLEIQFEFCSAATKNSEGRLLFDEKPA